MENERKSYLERKKELTSYYNARVSTYEGYANEPREKAIVNIVEEVSLFVNINPSYLYTIAVGEGLGSQYLDFMFDSKTGMLVTDVEVDGFQNLGLDFFSVNSEISRVKKYLPSNFNENDEYKIYQVERNEKYGEEIVPSATFKDLESAMYGFAAVLKHREELFLRACKQLGYTRPTEDEKAYWTYYYFQGEGQAYQVLSHNKGLNIFNNISVSRQSVHKKALERVASWRYVQHFNIFSK